MRLLLKSIRLTQLLALDEMLIQELMMRVKTLKAEAVRPGSFELGDNLSGSLA